MSLHKVALLAIACVALCGIANARRAVPVDTWQAPSPAQSGKGPPAGGSMVFDSNTQLGSGTLPDWLTSLIISPVPASALTGGGQIGGPNYSVNQPNTALPPADMWSFSQNSDENPPQSYGGQVALYPDASTDTLKIDLNYAAPSCAGQTGSLSINGLSFSSSNPCKGGIDTYNLPGCDPTTQACDDYNQSEFIFGLNGAGKLVLEDAVPSGWVSANAAPEIDSRGALGSILLLAGLIAVARGQRRVPQQ